MAKKVGLPAFLGLPEQDAEEAAVVVLPVPYEATTSYGKGAAFGPKAILEASAQVEMFDPDFGDEIQNFVKIATVEPVAEKNLLSARAGEYADKLLVSLGGEHSITPELVRPFLRKYPKLSVLQIDAHTDMRDEWGGRKDSHACAMRRVQEMGVKQIVQVGIRNTAKEEQQYLIRDNVFWKNRFKLEDVLARLTDHVYLTFDVDGLDISIMPATGTPEPEGLSFEQADSLLRAVATHKNLVAADFVELSPIKGMPAYDFLVAKLIFKLIGYKFAGEKKTR